MPLSPFEKHCVLEYTNYYEPTSFGHDEFRRADMIVAQLRGLAFEKVPLPPHHILGSATATPPLQPRIETQWRLKGVGYKQKHAYRRVVDDVCEWAQCASIVDALLMIKEFQMVYRKRQHQPF
jgi:hypothetical protein